MWVTFRMLNLLQQNSEEEEAGNLQILPFLKSLSRQVLRKKTFLSCGRAWGVGGGEWNYRGWTYSFHQEHQVVGGYCKGRRKSLLIWSSCSSYVDLILVNKVSSINELCSGFFYPFLCFFPLIVRIENKMTFSPSKWLKLTSSSPLHGCFKLELQNQTCD